MAEGSGDAEPLLALVGPTASGKTDAAVAIARSIDGEILSIDSTTVYRGLDVGTAKPDPKQRAMVPHHLIDVAEPGEPFSVAEFQRLGLAAIGETRRRGRVPFLVGGSGLYYRALVDRLEFPGTLPSIRRLLEAEARTVGAEALHRRLTELDPEAARRIEPSNARRTVRALEVIALTGRRFSSYYGAWDRFDPGVVRSAGIFIARAALHRRIENRAIRIMPGVLDETRRLLDQGHERFINGTQIIGYAEAAACLQGRITADEALATFIRRTKSLARRQVAWFRRDPRIRWFTAGEEGAAAIVDDVQAHLVGDKTPVTVTGRI
ncbi:MAG TPA: tRNA (adenosine(37)-N6)-dimethylallyltransferase MiaA [Actinomycetota bacterium]|nr:tRNA (adenosine(37)-N6)-dimethylallyltransferase MiaA [Actinomycetota bacterium]